MQTVGERGGVRTILTPGPIALLRGQVKPRLYLCGDTILAGSPVGSRPAMIRDQERENTFERVELTTSERKREILVVAHLAAPDRHPIFAQELKLTTDQLPVYRPDTRKPKPGVKQPLVWPVRGAG